MKRGAVAILGVAGLAMAAVASSRRPSPTGRDLVIWFGPVSPAQIRGATVPGVEPIVVACAGASCGALADSWLDGDGRKLPGMLRHLGFDEASIGRIFLGAFSAGGSAVKRLLDHAADRDRIAAVMLADATYSTGGTADAPEPIEQFVAYGQLALGSPHGSRLLLATSSAGPNGNHGSGDQVLAATATELERRIGHGLLPRSLPGTPQPEIVAAGNNVVLARYGGRLSHAGHASVLAKQLWTGVLGPHMGLQSGGAA